MARGDIFEYHVIVPRPPLPLPSHSVMHTMRVLATAAALLLAPASSLQLSRRSALQCMPAAGAGLASAAAGAQRAAAATPAPRDKSRTDGYKVQRSDREWAYVLSGAQYNVLRQGGTERPNSSILVNEKRKGTFSCAGCGTPLYSSETKFNSGTGWPSFGLGYVTFAMQRVPC